MANAQSNAPLPALPARPTDGHKGTFGRALVIAGSRGMSGAACLSGLAALRGGAGLVTVACPVSIQPIVAGFEPGYLTIGLPEDTDGRLDLSVLDQLPGRIKGQDAIAAGPGLGNTPDVRAVVQRLYNDATVPLVVDADGLNVLSPAFQEGRIARPPAAPRVLTPHPGEFSRLTGMSISEIEEKRQEAALQFAEQNQVILVLKGPGTIVTDGERLFINETGNSGMATGGSGDILTGILTALLATGGNPLDMTRLAVHLHGLAGDLATEELSQQGMIASDLPRYLCEAWKRVSRD